MANENVKIVLTAVDKTKRAFGSVRGGLTKVKSAVMSLQGALLALGAGAVFSKISKDIDNLGKTSAKLGIAAKDLEALRYAASFAGVETRTLDMAMQRFTRRLAEARKGTGEAKSALQEMGIALTNADGSARSQVEVLNDVADSFSAIVDPSDKVRLAFKLFDAEGVSMVNMLEQGSTALSNITQQFNDFGLSLNDEQIKQVEKTNDRLEAMYTIFGKIGDNLYYYLIRPLQNFSTYVVGQFLRGIAKIVGGVESLGNSLVGFANDLAEIFGLAEVSGNFDFSGTVKSLNTMADAVQGVGQTVLEVSGANGKGGLSGLNTTVKQNAEAWVEATEPLKEYAEASMDLYDSIQQGAMKGIKSLEDGLVGLIKGTESVSDSFRNMASSIIDDLIRIQIQKSITKPLSGLLSAGVSDFAQNVATASKYGTNIGSEQTRLIQAQDYNALGGQVSAGKPTIVGEHGRETFIPSSNGTIVPNDKMGGGVTVVQNINISTGVQQTVRNEIAGLMPQIAAASKQAVMDARKRGGSFSAAFGA